MEYEKPILIIDDDESVCQTLRAHLTQEGYRSESVPDQLAGLGLALSGAYSLVVLELGNRTFGGLDLCKRLREEDSSLPIIIVTDKTTELEKVLGLECGADDYVTKPFSVYELMARIRIQLRKAAALRSCPPDSGRRAPGVTFHIGELKLDVVRRRVTIRGEPIELTVKEYDLLSLLVQNPGLPFSREQIVEAVWNTTAMGYADTVGSVILRLRRKLKRHPTDPELILTVRGIGYRFIESEELGRRNDAGDTLCTFSVSRQDEVAPLPSNNICGETPAKFHAPVVDSPARQPITG